jgi:sugar lactone lactonase YvrE
LTQQGGARAAPSLQVIATVGGQPDDITVDQSGRLVWGDLASGTVRRLQGGHVTTIARGIAVPEGVVVLANGSLVVAAQGTDQVIRITPAGKRSVLRSLQPVAGQEGVDGIGFDARSKTLLVPDSPRGSVLRMTLTGRHARLIASGLGRPVAAVVDGRGNVLVPDEHLGTLVVISPGGVVSHRGSFATPDDVAVDRAGRVWVTSLGDGGLWLLAPGKQPREVISGLSNPQGLTLDRCGDPVVVDQATARIVRLLLKASSGRCRF